MRVELLGRGLTFDHPELAKILEELAGAEAPVKKKTAPMKENPAAVKKKAPE